MMTSNEKNRNGDMGDIGSLGNSRITSTLIPPAGLVLHETEPAGYGDMLTVKELWKGVYAVQIESADTIGFLARICSYPHQTENLDNGKQLLAERVEERLGQQFAALAWFIKENGLDARRIEELRDRQFMRYVDNPPPGILVETPEEIDK